MELKIYNTLSFYEIQSAFNQAYPFLWIDFFHPGPFGSNPAKNQKVKGETTVEMVCPFEGIKTISIQGSKSVAQLELDFRNLLCVDVKVLRKSGKVWVETSFTGKWTLEFQNFEGEQITY